MSEQETKSIALFFFLALLDNRKGLELSKKVAKKLKKSWSADSSINHKSSLVAECFSAWSLALADKAQIIGSVVSSEEWTLPQNVGLEAWKKFLQLEQRENVFPLIWTEIIGYEDHEVAKAINVSQGTVRTRVARGLTHLGAHCTAERANG